MEEPLTSEELPSIEEVLRDPSASFWLKAALRSALFRDPVDAANDAEVLARLLERHLSRTYSRPLALLRPLREIKIAQCECPRRRSHRPWRVPGKESTSRRADGLVSGSWLCAPACTNCWPALTARQFSLPAIASLFIATSSLYNAPSFDGGRTKSARTLPSG